MGKGLNLVNCRNAVYMESTFRSGPRFEAMSCMHANIDIEFQFQHGRVEAAYYSTPLESN